MLRAGPEVAVTERVVVSEVAVATSDPDEALAFINETYVGARARPGADVGVNFRFELSGRATAQLQVANYRYTRGMSLELDPFGYLMALAVTRGDVEVGAGTERHRGSGGSAFLNPIDRPMHVAWGDDFVGSLFAMPLEPVRQWAAEQTGIAAEDLRFTSMRPVSSAMAALWRKTMSFVTSQLAGPDPPAASPLVEQATVELAAAVALACFPNTTMTLDYVPGDGRVAPAAVRRAVAYIDEHAAEPITLTQLAEVARMTGRALEYAFARQYGTTPTGYMRRVRLERAHHDLRAGDPTAGATVAAIARRWGWAKPSAFTAAYRQQFGTLPSHTLRS